MDRATGLICDQIIVLTGQISAKFYPQKIRLIKFHDPETGNILVFLTNNFVLPALTIAHLYRCRWKVELFFQMNQAEPTDQSLLRRKRERR